MAVALDILAWAALLAGSFFLLVGGAGLLRMPDFFTRGHAAGVTDTLGAGLILVGLMIEAGWSLNLGRLILILFFLLFTSPTASHALAHAALAAGVKPWTRKSASDSTQPIQADAPNTPTMPPSTGPGAPAANAPKGA